MVTERDYYEVLEVSRTATDEEIKRSFRKLAQQWHPDVNTDAGADGRFKEINEAYQVLSDPQRRQAYDMFGQAGVNGAGATRGFGAGFGGFGDIFDAFFGGAAAGGVRHGRPPAGATCATTSASPSPRPSPGRRRRSSSRSSIAATTCEGSGAEPGTPPTPAPSAAARGEVRQVRQTMLGQMVNVTACQRCRGEGKIVEQPCQTCQGDGRVERKRNLRVTDPARHRRRPPDPPLRRGRGRAARRAAGQPLRRGPRRAPPGAEARGDRALLRARVSITQAALGTRVADPDRRWRRGDRDQARHPARGPRSGCAARACRTCAGAGSRGDLHVLVDVDGPDASSARRQRSCSRPYAAGGGRGRSAPAGHGGILERGRAMPLG